MTGIDENHSALGEATRLPGQVRVRPAAPYTIRTLARRRRRTGLLAAAAVLPACGVVVAALAGIGDSGVQRTIAPATRATPAPSLTPATSEPTISVTSGHRTLPVPVEVYPVLEEHTTCPSGPDFVAAAESGGCYRLGPVSLVIREVRGLTAGRTTSNSGQRTRLTLDLVMSDAAELAALNDDLTIKQLAMVVNGSAYEASQLVERLAGGTISVELGSTAAKKLIADLGGRRASTTKLATPRPAARCPLEQVEASLEGGGVALGTTYWRIELHNVGSRPCSLRGFPTVAFFDAGHQELTVSRRSPDQRATTVTLDVGGWAHAILGEVGTGNFEPSAPDCRPQPVVSIRVSLSRTSEAVELPHRADVCTTKLHRPYISSVLLGRKG